MKKILIFSKVSGLTSLVKENLKNHTILEPRSKEELVSYLPEAEIILTDPDSFFLENIHKAKSCKWIQSTWAGVDGFFKNEKVENYPFTLTRFGGMFILFLI